jgi:CubicO group peptidase (beta-lactamase class C family)
MPVPDDIGLSAERLQRIPRALSIDIERGVVPGAVMLISRHGEIGYSSAFGYRDRESGAAMPMDAMFWCASMTKPIASVAALMLAEQGKLHIYDSAATYLPELRNMQVAVESRDDDGTPRLATIPATREITVQDLMRHTSGFTYGQFGDTLTHRAYREANMTSPQQTNAEMVAKLAHLPLRFQPGTTFEYGMSTDVLGAIVEVVSGMDLRAFITTHITRPLGMMDTDFVLSPSALARLAQPPVDPATGQRIAFYDPAKPPTWFSGGGGLFTTATDYWRFAQMLLNGGVLDGVRILGRKTVALMASNHLPPGVAFGEFTPSLGVGAPLPERGQGFGLGLAIRMEQGRGPAPGSIGDFSWGGVSGTFWWADPQEQLVAVFLMQAPLERVRYRSLIRNLVYQAVL